MGTNAKPAASIQYTLDALRRIVQVLRESSRWAEQHVGLSGAQLFVLQRLAEAPASSLNDLARRTHTHQSTVSAVVTRLVERGLVLRKPSGTDARSVQLSLSARGRRTLAGAPDAPQARLIRAVEKLSAPRRRQLATALAEVAQAIGGPTGAPVMFFDEARHVRRQRMRGAAAGEKHLGT